MPLKVRWAANAQTTNPRIAFYEDDGREIEIPLSLAPMEPDERESRVLISAANMLETLAEQLRQRAGFPTHFRKRSTSQTSGKMRVQAVKSFIEEQERKFSTRLEFHVIEVCFWLAVNPGPHQNLFQLGTDHSQPWTPLSRDMLEHRTEEDRGLPTPFWYQTFGHDKNSRSFWVHSFKDADRPKRHLQFCLGDRTQEEMQELYSHYEKTGLSIEIYEQRFLYGEPIAGAIKMLLK